ncbi:MAG: hypothetical protein DMG05_15505 [Acidobacteria bacterium]|nr:MAG: hypothetical protein DMG05_15505 [Acidobacteriota bacterium]
MNFYEALNLEPDATTEKIEEAYRRLARKVHPDLNPQDSPTAEARMKLLNEIRDTLTHPLRRATYDAELKAPAQQPIANRIKQGLFRASRKWGTLFSPRWAILLVAVAAGFIFGVLPFYYNSGLEQIVEPTVPKVPEAQMPRDKLPRRAMSRSESTLGQRKTTKVIQVGSTLREVTEELGRPDRVEEFSPDGIRILYYGKLRLLIRDGKVAQGSGVR